MQNQVQTGRPASCIHRPPRPIFRGLLILTWRETLQRGGRLPLIRSMHKANWYVNQLSKVIWESYLEQGNILFSNELARRYGDEGIISISTHPGILFTELFRYHSSFKRFFTVTSFLARLATILNLCHLETSFVPHLRWSFDSIMGRDLTRGAGTQWKGISFENFVSATGLLICFVHSFFFHGDVSPLSHRSMWMTRSGKTCGIGAKIKQQTSDFQYLMLMY